MNSKINISKYHMGLYIQLINNKIKEMKSELENDGGNEELSSKTSDLSDLKADVLLKLMNENKAKVSVHYYHGFPCYTFKINRFHAFHLTKSNRVKKAVRKYEQKEKKCLAGSSEVK